MSQEITGITEFGIEAAQVALDHCDELEAVDSRDYTVGLYGGQFGAGFADEVGQILDALRLGGAVMDASELVERGPEATEFRRAIKDLIVDHHSAEECPSYVIERELANLQQMVADEGAERTFEWATGKM